MKDRQLWEDEIESTRAAKPSVDVEREFDKAVKMALENQALPEEMDAGDVILEGGTQMLRDKTPKRLSDEEITEMGDLIEVHDIMNE